MDKTVSVWERRGNLGLDIAKSRAARLRGDRKKKKKKRKKKLARIFCLDIAAKDHWATIARSITWNYASMAIDLGVEVKQPRS